MKFLLDQGLPRSAIQHLRAIGLEAEHVGQLGVAVTVTKRRLALRRLPPIPKNDAGPAHGETSSS